MPVVATCPLTPCGVSLLLTYKNSKLMEKSIFISYFSTPLTFLVGFVVLPLVSYFLCRWLLPKRWGRKAGIVLACILIGLFSYSLTFGFEQLEVRHVVYESADLPEAFDGYRIVQFSDLHLGSFKNHRGDYIPRMVDSILAQKGDMIVFTGDIQNIWPSETLPYSKELSRLHAPDGVYSILGNHDYDVYQDCDEETKKANCLLTEKYERDLGWDLLMNEHRIIRRGADSLVLAGMENRGNVTGMPRLGNVGMSVQGVDTTSFMVMLQHDPSAWRRSILGECHAQLTLSGHTHGMQFGIFGWSPLALKEDEWGGFVYEGPRALFVTTGVGGLIPLRLGMPGEIVAITLKKK